MMVKPHFHKYVMRKYELVEREIPRNTRDVRNLFLSAGWFEVGAGYYAEVYGKSEKDYVVKVFERDGAYLAFLKMIQEHPNKHFPKVKGRVWISPSYNGVRLEKLYPADPKYARMLSTYLINKRDGFVNDALLEKANEYIRDKPELLAALDMIDEKLLNRFHLDLGADNVMQRADGTIVITDPIQR